MMPTVFPKGSTMDAVMKPPPAFGGGRVTVCPVRNEGGERRVNIVGVPVGDG